MPSKLDPHLVTIESWLATEPQITALSNQLLDQVQAGHVAQLAQREDAHREQPQRVAGREVGYPVL